NTVFPPRTSDFASFLIGAANSGADVLAISAASGDTETLIKQADEFGLKSKMNIVPLQSVLPDIKGIGLQIAQGFYEVSPFYWDRTDDTRAWAARFFAKAKAMPSSFQAGVYSVVGHYLRAVRAVGSDDSEAVMNRMNSQRIYDVFADNGY